MNEKVMGICYIIVAVLILVVKYAVPQFFDVLIWLVAIGLLIGGVYFLLRE
jgi:type IV secretory pathway TrbD component